MVKKYKSQQTLSSLLYSEGSSLGKTTQVNNNDQYSNTSRRESITSGGELTHIRGSKIFTVSEVTRLIKNYLESNNDLINIWLRGEITNFTLHRSGHMYFDLKDENTQMPCVMFKSANQHLKFKPEHGLKVLGYGSISVYIPHGKYQYVLTDLLPDGLGALHLAYLQLKDKLSNEGLFAIEHKIPIPQIPKTIGVVTSPTGAAIKDIIRVAIRRFPGVHIILAPSKVQGEDAVTELIAGINKLHEIGNIDLIILGRGGGSLEDLWAFNEEALAYAIYNASIPIISAVGHETDFTISDFVADQRAPTPSAAAEIAVPDIKDITKIITNNISQLKQYLENKIGNYKLHLTRLLESPVFTRPIDRINLHRQNLDNIIDRFSTNISNYYRLKQSNLQNIIGKLSAMNPKAILNRGYSMAIKLPENKLISSVDTVGEKDKLRLILKDGSVKCEVEDKIRNEDKNE